MLQYTEEMIRPSTSHKPHPPINESLNTKQISHLLRRNNNFIIDTPKSFPKLINKDILSKETAQIDREKFMHKVSFCNTLDIKNKNHPHQKTIFKILDQEHKNINRENMQMLGLTIQKINYSWKNRRVSCFQGNNEINTIGAITNEPLNLQNYQNMMEFQVVGDKRPSNVGFKPVRNTRTPQTIRPQNRSSSKHNERRKSVKAINPEYQNPVYQARIYSYRQLLFKLNWTYGHYMDMERLDQDSSWREKRFKAFIGGGNNSGLIKQLIRRRFWWQIIEDKNSEINFLWTQLKNNDFFKKQQPSCIWYLTDMKKATQNMSKQLTVSKELSKNVKKPRHKKQESYREDEFLYKIMSESQQQSYLNAVKNIRHKECWQRQNTLKLKVFSPENEKVHNHLINNFYLGNKKALFYNLKEYYELSGGHLFKTIPLTFHIKKGTKDLQYKRFVMYHKKRQIFIKKQQKEVEKGLKISKMMRNIWIVKPGQLTNRGNGITVIDQVYQLDSIIKSEGKHDNGVQKTFIVQLYIDRPFLYKKRKFDIRHYMIISQLNGIFKAYWYKEGYIRTSSYQFDVFNFQREIHLTNDAVQKYTPAYGRYQAANKLSYQEFQKYLDTNYLKQKYNLQDQILPKMKEICLDAVKSVFIKISPDRFKHNFQIFGLDFMIDHDFNPWLIQINTNPCLQLACPLLTRIIPQMVDQTFRLTLDVIYPPPCNYPNTVKHLVPDASLESLKFQLIFDQRQDGQAIRNLYKKTKSNLLQEIGNISDDEVYQDNTSNQVLLDELL